MSGEQQTLSAINIYMPSVKDARKMRMMSCADEEILPTRTKAIAIGVVWSLSTKISTRRSPSFKSSFSLNPLSLP
jgi:hypothetical protein